MKPTFDTLQKEMEANIKATYLTYAIVYFKNHPSSMGVKNGLSDGRA